MFGKIFDLLVAIAVNGIMAMFVSLFFLIILAFVFCFAMIPVSVIFGDGTANAIYGFAENVGFRVVYAIVFISMMMDDLGIPNAKSAVKKWWDERKKKNIVP